MNHSKSESYGRFHQEVPPQRTQVSNARPGPPANLDISITVTMGDVKSASYQMTTHVPYRMIAGAHDHTCPSYYGYEDILHYDVQDQLRNSLSIYVFDYNEAFTTGFINDNGSNWGSPNTGPGQDNNVNDYISGPEVGYSPSPVPFPVCSGNDIQAQHATQQWYVGSIATSKGVMLQAEQFTRYADKGDHLNIVPVHP